MNFKINDSVYVTIYKGGYWVDRRKGTVVGLTAKRVKVNTLRGGTQNYKPENVSKR